MIRSSTDNDLALEQGKHHFEGPDGEEYEWRGKGDDVKLVATKGSDTTIAEWEPKSVLRCYLVYRSADVVFAEIACFS